MCRPALGPGPPPGPPRRRVPGRRRPWSRLWGEGVVAGGVSQVEGRREGLGRGRCLLTLADPLPPAVQMLAGTHAPKRMCSADISRSALPMCLRSAAPVIDRMRQGSIVGLVGPLHGPGWQRSHASVGQPDSLRESQDCNAQLQAQLSCEVPAPPGHESG